MKIKPGQATRYLVGKNVQRLREEWGESRSKICRGLTMSRAFYNDVEQGRKSASPRTLERLAGTFSEGLKREIAVGEFYKPLAAVRAGKPPSAKFKKLEKLSARMRKVAARKKPAPRLVARKPRGRPKRKAA